MMSVNEAAANEEVHDAKRKKPKRRASEVLERQDATKRVATNLLRTAQRVGTSSLRVAQSPTRLEVDDKDDAMSILVSVAGAEAQSLGLQSGHPKPRIFRGPLTSDDPTHDRASLPPTNNCSVEEGSLERRNELNRANSGSLQAETFVNFLFSTPELTDASSRSTSARSSDQEDFAMQLLLSAGTESSPGSSHEKFQLFCPSCQSKTLDRPESFPCANGRYAESYCSNRTSHLLQPEVSLIAAVPEQDAINIEVTGNVASQRCNSAGPCEGQRNAENDCSDARAPMDRKGRSNHKPNISLPQAAVPSKELENRQNNHLSLRDQRATGQSINPHCKPKDVQTSSEDPSMRSLGRHRLSLGVDHQQQAYTKAVDNENHGSNFTMKEDRRELVVATSSPRALIRARKLSVYLTWLAEHGTAPPATLWQSESIGSGFEFLRRVSKIQLSCIP